MKKMRKISRESDDLICIILNVNLLSKYFLSLKKVSDVNFVPFSPIK